MSADDLHFSWFPTLYFSRYHHPASAHFPLALMSAVPIASEPTTLQLKMSSKVSAPRGWFTSRYVHSSLRKPGAGVSFIDPPSSSFHSWLRAKLHSTPHTHTHTHTLGLPVLSMRCVCVCARFGHSHRFSNGTDDGKHARRHRTETPPLTPVLHSAWTFPRVKLSTSLRLLIDSVWTTHAQIDMSECTECIIRMLWFVSARRFPHVSTSFD